jgi:hypothetical protein
MDIDIDISGTSDFVVAVDEESVSEMGITVEVSNPTIGPHGCVRIVLSWGQLEALYRQLAGWFEVPAEDAAR